jgi:putative phage-type endonuclease
MSDQANREAWLAWRRSGLSATDVAGVLGLSPYASPYAVWADKAGLLPDIEVTDAMEFGTRAEPMLAEWFHDRTGLYVLGEQTWCTHPSERWMLATVDGFVSESPAGSIGAALGGAEFKTTTDTAAEWNEAIPDHIACQVQWQMAATGLPVTYLATLHLGFRVEFRVREVVRDEADIEALVGACSTFWHEHCLTGVPPATDGSEATTEALRAAFPGDTELDAVTATPELVGARWRILSNEEQVKICLADIDADKNLIRAALGDHTALTDGVDEKGRPVVLATWKPSTRTVLDTALLKANEPDVFAKYLKTTPLRSLLVKAPKKGTN